MEREVLEQLPQLQGVLEALQKADMADLVWEVLGGNPARYDLLQTAWREAGYKDIVKVAEGYLRDELSAATNVLNDTVAAYPALEQPIYKRFKEEAIVWLPASVRAEHIMPSPDKVLRFIKKAGDEEGMLVPSTAAMALVLRHSVDHEPPSLSTVRQSLQTKVQGRAAAMVTAGTTGSAKELA